MQLVNKLAFRFYYQTGKRKVSQRTIEHVTGHLHDDVIYLLQPAKSTSGFSLFVQIRAFNLLFKARRITKFKHERKSRKVYGRSDKMTPSSRASDLLEVKLICQNYQLTDFLTIVLGSTNESL